MGFQEYIAFIIQQPSIYEKPQAASAVLGL
jgi:hypothetical protein